MELEVNKDRIRLWVEALRSGEFDQTIQTLGIPADEEGGKDRMCCLGVACEVAMRNGAPVTRRLFRPSPAASDRYKYSCEGYDDDKEMPLSVARWFGLDETNPYVEVQKLLQAEDSKIVLYPGQGVRLAVCNDIYRLNFNEIAHLIEAAYLCDEEQGL